MQPRQHKTASFLSAHPVFTRAEFAAAFGHPASAANVTSLLRHHLRAGNIKRVSREVFAAVPAHLAADRMVIDRFAAASKLRSDGVLGFHSALELNGITYSEFNEVQLVSAGRTEHVDLPFGACRFVAPPKALAAAGKTDYLTTTMATTVRSTAVTRTGTPCRSDINYLYRGALYGVDRMPSVAIGSYQATNVPVLDIHEIIAGKMVALVTRRTARDLFDAHRIIAMPSLDWAKIKAATLMIGASAKSFAQAAPQSNRLKRNGVTTKARNVADEK
jgi:hypothetical protein